GRSRPTRRPSFPWALIERLHPSCPCPCRTGRRPGHPCGSSQRPWLQHLRRKADDLHVLLGTKLADDRAEDTGADRLLVLVDQHRGIRIEAYHRTVGTADVLRGAHDHSAVNVALLHAAAGRRFLDADDDDVADASGTTLRPA